MQCNFMDYGAFSISGFHFDRIFRCCENFLLSTLDRSYDECKADNGKDTT